MSRKSLSLFLAAGAIVATVAVVAWWRSTPPAPIEPEKSPLRLVWTFEAPQPGFVVGAPVVSTEAIYLAVGHPRGFHQQGAVYALDPATGQPKWVYDHDGAMLHSASTPLLVNGRLFVGEGLHNNFSCRLHCIDTRTGKDDWTFPTGDHIEGGAARAGDRVIFPAGNDGVYAVDAKSGRQRWNFRANLHIDSTPFVLNDRVFVGSGPSRRFDTLQVVCLDAATGQPVWRTPVDLPAWGSPVVAAGRVFVGLGNGQLTQAAPAPAGGLACLDAATGVVRWTASVPDAVFGRPVVAGERVVFGSRDGNLRGLTFDGTEIFRLPMGGPVMASPAADGERVVAVAVSGRIVCVNAKDGLEIWRYELKKLGSEPKVYAAPRMAERRLIVAGEMMAGPNAVICLFCFDLPEGSP